MSWTHWFAGMMDAGPDDRLYNCLPMYHSVGGVVASGAVLLARRRGDPAREILRQRASGDDVADSGATIFQYIGELCRYLLASRGDAPAHSLRLAVRQRAVRRYLGGFPGALCHSADPGILCRHRRQFLALQCRRQSRRHRPHSGLSGAPLPHRLVSSMRRRRRAGARAGRLVHRASRAAKPARPSARSPAARRGSRAIPMPPPPTKKILRDVFEPGDAWVRTRRSDAPGRAGLFLFRGPDRRHLPLERRECRHHRSRRRAASAVPASTPPTSMAWRCRAHDGKCRHGGAGSRRAISISPALRAHLAARLPAYARPLFPAPGSVTGGHRDLQAEEAAIWRRGFRSRARSPTRFMPIAARAMCRWMPRFMRGSIPA